MKYLLLALVGCTVGLSAAQSTPTPDPYCEAVLADVQICRDDFEIAWRCTANEYGWSCKRITP